MPKMFEDIFLIMQNCPGALYVKCEGERGTEDEGVSHIFSH